MAGAISDAGCATACDTPRRAKSRISAPRAELARLPSACTTSGAVPPRTNTTSRRNRRACAGRHTTASRRNTTIWKIGGPWASWPGSLGTDGEWGRCAKNAFDDAPCLVRYTPIFCRPYTRGAIGSLVRGLDLAASGYAVRVSLTQRRMNGFPVLMDVRSSVGLSFSNGAQGKS